MPRSGVGGSFCWKNRANSALPESGFVRLSRAKSSFLLLYRLRKNCTRESKTERTRIEGKSRGIKNVTLLSAGEMRFARYTH